MIAFSSVLRDMIRFMWVTCIDNYVKVHIGNEFKSLYNH